MIGIYNVGEIPSTPIIVKLVDLEGAVVSLGQYTKVEPLLLDPQNNIVDMRGTTIGAQNQAGEFYLKFPEDRSVFDRRGEYVLQLVLHTAAGERDFTREFTIHVKETGGK